MKIAPRPLALLVALLAWSASAAFAQPNPRAIAPAAQATYSVEVVSDNGQLVSRQTLHALEGRPTSILLVQAGPPPAQLAQRGFYARVDFKAWTRLSALSSMSAEQVRAPDGSARPQGSLASTPASSVDLLLGQRVKLLSAEEQSVYVTLTAINAL